MKHLGMVLLLTTALFTADSVATEVCRELLTSKLDYTLKKPRHFTENGRRLNSRNSLDLYVLDTTGKVVGTMGGILEEDSYYDFNIYLDEGFQRRGLSYVFFTKFFEKFPKTRPFKFLIIDQNLEVFLKGLDQGLSYEQAAQKVYSVKALVKFGYIFSKIEYDPDISEQVYITLTPPNS